MANCCACAQDTCRCALQVNGGLTLTGTGQPGNPWVLTADGADVAVQDGDCIDLGISGAGTAADPKIITADLLVDPAAANLASCGPNGLIVAPTEVTVEDTPTLDLTLTGTGAPGDPWTISGVPILVPNTDVPDGGQGTGNLLKANADGLYVSCEDVQDCVGNAVTALLDGIRYDDAGNALIVQVSADPNNQLRYSLNDGGLFVPAASTALQALDTPCIDMTVTGTGTAADPFVVSAAPKLDPAATNAITCGPNGLLVPAGSAALNVNDDECIDLTLTGTGTTADPWVLSAAPILDPAAGNQLACGPNGLFVPQAAGTVIQANNADEGTSRCIDVAVTGAGTAASPFQIGAAPIVASAGTACGPGIVSTQLLSCQADGLHADLAVDGSQCNALEGDGTCNSPLFIGPLDKLSTSPLWSIQDFANASDTLNDPVATGVGADQKRTHGTLVTASITNPSSCREMYVIISARVNGNINKPANAAETIALRVGVEVHASAFYPAGGSRSTAGESGPQAATQYAFDEYLIEMKGPIAPGATYSVDAQVVTQSNPTGVAQQGTVTQTTVNLFLLGVLT